MSRLRKTLRSLLAVGLAGSLGILALAKPVERASSDGSSYRQSSLSALTTALDSLTEIPEVGPLSAGVGRVEIAPPIDWAVPLAGNRSLRFARAEGKRAESVWARAVALSQGDARFLLVSADIMVVHPGLSARVLERVREATPIEGSELMLVAAHTHSGPGGYWQGFLAEQSVGPYQERILGFLVDGLARAAIDAWESRGPVVVSAGTRSVPFAVKNRAWPPNPENDQLGLVRFEAVDGSFVVDLVNYSAHPTNLIKGNRLLTGDYPALMALEVDSDRRTLIFTPGTIGDMKPSYDGIRDGAARAAAIADHLVEAGLDRLDPQPIEAPHLESFEFVVDMPPLQPRVLRSNVLGSWCLRPWVAERLFPGHVSTAVVQVARLGPVVLIGAPSDLSSTLALPLIEAGRRSGLMVLFVGMAEDWIGYVMADGEYDGLAYKETSQFHGPQSGPLFEEIYRVLIAAMAERRTADANRSS